jgi:uncharacterized protein YbaR (Trm112 family)
VIDKELLDILVCPKSHKPLRMADEPLVTKLNKAIAAANLKNVAGRPVDAALQGGLVCDEESIVYPVVDGIPILLIDEAIPLDQLGPDP